MPILPYAKKLFPNRPDQEVIYQYMVMKDQLLEWDTQNRIFGIKNKLGTGFRRVGYILSRDFFEGDQWLYAKEEGATMNVVNFCRMTVDNNVAFLTQKTPEIDIPPKDVKDPIEVARVTEVEKLLRDILDDLKFPNTYYDAVQNGSILGDSILVGPFWDKDEKRLRLWNIKRPEYVRIIWKSEDFDEILGGIIHYYLSVEEAVSRWGDLFAEKGIDVRTLGTENEPAPTTARLLGDQTDKVKRVLVREIWDDQMHEFVIDHHIIKYEVHNFGFVPIHHVRNMPHPYLPWGTSDIEDLVDVQKQYNEQSSDMQDLLKILVTGDIFGKNLDIEEITAGGHHIYDFGDDAQVFPDPRRNDFPALQTFLTDRKDHISTVSGIPAAFQGTQKGVENISGRALSVIMTPINNKVLGKEQRWAITLQEIVRDILILLERFVPESRHLIQGYYKSEVFFPGTMIRDVTEELNKFIQKAQSQYTTMKNIGIASPKDEQEIIKQELSDPQLVIELSKNPAMQQAVIQQMVSGARGAAPGAAPSGASGGGLIGSEGENQGNEQPASASGNATPTGATPSGNIAAANVNTNAAPTQIPAGRK
jgi:hypothetical protein